MRCSLFAVARSTFSPSPEPRATELPSYRTTERPSDRATELPNYRTTELPNELPNYRATMPEEVRTI